MVLYHQVMKTRAVVLLRYRSLQVVSDLVGQVTAAPDDALARIAAAQSIPEGRARLNALVHEDGCRIAGPDAQSLHTALILCATMADTDPDAFFTATAILLADRLQLGEGADDLFWHWDGFQGQYLSAPAPMRAALLQGFHEAASEGLVELFDPPEMPNLATDTHEAMVALGRKPISAAFTEAHGLIHGAIAGGDVPEALWREVCEPLLSAPDDLPKPLLRAIRHLFEARPGWSPYGGNRFPLYGRTPPLIPRA